ncbi:hypothetical protein AR687_06775 [Flavobacteriaceae bacterium CRH]|nr:hypothetical protein AR687_06775 [Flavobacteriaceae bacterium CRH]
MKVLLISFFVINGVAFILAGYDKYLAVKHKRRIPENTLFLLAAIGGSLGLLLAMLLFKHKTSKTSFITKFSVIFLIQIVLVIAGLNNKI